MAFNYLQRTNRIAPDRNLTVGIGLMALAVIATGLATAILGGLLDTFQYSFLLPWIIGLGCVMAAPMVILYYRGELSLANPLVFATASYLAPAFVVGGLFLAGGLSTPYLLTFIQDPQVDLPFTVVLVGIGHIGLSLGYFFSLGPKIGSFIARNLPIADYPSDALVFPGLLLLGLGVANTVFAFMIGLLGYQISTESSTYDGLIFLSTLWRSEASFLLWLLIFRQQKLTTFWRVIATVLVAINVGMALFAGNRGSLAGAFIAGVLAFVLTGRKLNARQGVFATVTLAACLLVGIVYGTTFRNIKGTEAQQSIEQYSDTVVRTFETVGSNGGLGDAGIMVQNFAERIDALSSVAVVVSNYEQLRPFEEGYGLDNNIYKDTVTFLIPRALWPEKPVASHARLYSALYFDFGESSFTITPMGDLLRNYGVIGVPIGMFLLGFLVRIIYRALVEDQPKIVWRCVFYFMLLTSISYESFYGLILPNLFRTGVSAAIGVALVLFLAHIVKLRSNQ
ncbi:MAG: hypothetical protein ABL984_12085 [Pyrinomonadaceae bacterium]